MKLRKTALGIPYKSAGRIYDWTEIIINGETRNKTRSNRIGYTLNARRFHINRHLNCEYLTTGKFHCSVMEGWRYYAKSIKAEKFKLVHDQ